MIDIVLFITYILCNNVNYNIAVCNYVNYNIVAPYLLELENV